MKTTLIENPKTDLKVPCLLEYEDANMKYIVLATRVRRDSFSGTVISRSHDCIYQIGENKCKFVLDQFTRFTGKLVLEND